jgi:acyl carrier protein
MKLYQIVGNILGVDPATLDEESNAQNTPRWDSLHHIEVIFAVESAYQVRFTMPEIASLRKLGDIRRLLIAKNAPVEPKPVPEAASEPARAVA